MNEVHVHVYLSDIVDHIMIIDYEIIGKMSDFIEVLKPKTVV